MSETTTISASDVLCNLKAVVADLECQQKQQLFKQLQQQLQQEQELKKRQQQEREQEKKTPAQQPMYLMIPIEDTQKRESENQSNCTQSHRNCSSKGSTQSQGKTQKTEHDKKKHHVDPLELKGVKSRELRGGILYTGCGCLHRDGLQDDCPRSECQGKPACLTKPWATCPPGILGRTRHPEMFGAPPNPDAVTF